MESSVLEITDLLYYVKKDDADAIRSAYQNPTKRNTPKEMGI